MRYVFLLIVNMIILSCVNKKINKENGNTSTTNYEPCICENSLKTSNIIYATNSILEKENGINKLIFNCFNVKTINTNQEPYDLHHEIKCISPSKQEFILSKDFTYSSYKLANIRMTLDGLQNLFFEEIANENKKVFFQINLSDDKEIISVSQLKID